jgi:hypothetical protein
MRHKWIPEFLLATLPVVVSYAEAYSQTPFDRRIQRSHPRPNRSYFPGVVVHIANQDIGASAWPHENSALQFKAEFYNALNHPQFSDPDNNFTRLHSA